MAAEDDELLAGVTVDTLKSGARLRRNEFGPGAPWLGDRLPTPADRAPVRATQS
jgi:hypothetical protein